MSSKSCSSEPKQGGDGAVLGDQPFQNSASAITISFPLACRREGSLYKVEVVGSGGGTIVGIRHCQVQSAAEHYLLVIIMGKAA